MTEVSIRGFCFFVDRKAYPTVNSLHNVIDNDYQLGYYIIVSFYKNLIITLKR